MALLTFVSAITTAPLDARERLAFTESEIPDALARLRALPGVDEAAILSTCNRTEIFAVTSPEEEAGCLNGGGASGRHRQVVSKSIHTCCVTKAACCTACGSQPGLDSMVVGEPQILGQMKHAFAQAQGAESLGPVLSRLFQHAFAVAKLVRSRTEVGAHPVTIAYAAVQLAQHILPISRTRPRC